MKWHVYLYFNKSWLRWSFNGPQGDCETYAMQLAARGVWNGQTFYPPHRITHVKIRRAK